MSEERKERKREKIEFKILLTLDIILNVFILFYVKFEKLYKFYELRFFLMKNGFYE